MISLRAASVCFLPLGDLDGALCRASRPLPLIQSILFFLNRNSTPPVSPLTILSLRAWTCAMSMPIAASPSVRPHSFQSCATFSAWACSRSAFVGMQPQLRHVPPSDGRALDHRGLQPELRRTDGGDVAARARADDHDVVFVRHYPFFLSSSTTSGTKVTVGGAGGGRVGLGRRRPRSGSSAPPASAAACSRSAAPSTDWFSDSSLRGHASNPAPVPRAQQQATMPRQPTKAQRSTLQQKRPNLTSGAAGVKTPLQSGNFRHDRLEDHPDLRRRSGHAGHARRRS